MEERLLSLFVSMLNLGLAGGLAALLVLPVRLALSRAPKRYSCWLWAAVFFRFACPFVPQSPLAPGGGAPAGHRDRDPVSGRSPY